MARAALIAALVLAAAAARAAPAVTLDGCGGLVDEGELRELLRVELGDGDGDAPLALRCAAGATEVSVLAGGRADRVSLADVPERMRARTLALALAERVRRDREDAAAPPREAPPPPPPSPSPAPPAVAALAPPPPSPAPSRRRLYGGLAVGLFTFSLAGIAIGAPLTAIDAPNPEFRDLHITGGVFMGVAAVAFATSAVTFGLWLRERRVKPPR